jgi:GMP synthase-like glutamine amidotransferase
MRPVAIFRFSPTEGPAYFADWLDARGIAWRLVPLDQGVPVPSDPREFGGLGMMGGPMSANDDLPWNVPLLSLLRAAVAAEVPVIGHCLGGQLFARALGASVTRAPVPEIGWRDVDVADMHARNEWFGGRAAFTTFQWHYDAFALPAGSTRVLTSAFNPEQGFIVDDRHIGFQCHIEMTRPLVETWLATGAAELPAVTSAATQTDADIRRGLDERVAGLNALASCVYARWARGLRH